MARRVNTSSVPPKKRPLPPLGWAIVGLVVILFGVGLWYYNRLNINEWRHVQKLGIRLPMKYEIHGIDISKHNGRIDWKLLREMRFEDLRLQFAFVKATEGTSLIDKDFKTNWQQADEVGLYRGAYHFYIPWKPALPQFENFKKVAKLKKGDLPPVLDFEIGTNAYSREQVIENLRTWLQLAENHYGVQPIIYTNADFYRRYIKDNLDNYPLWIADYSGWTLNRYDDATIYFWQHSKSGYSEGVRGLVDYNVFLGDVDALKRICVK
ncbi:MAG: glycoside hydrolase family 25 protein [Runella zeae]